MVKGKSLVNLVSLFLFVASLSAFTAEASSVKKPEKPVQQQYIDEDGDGICDNTGVNIPDPKKDGKGSPKKDKQESPEDKVSRGKNKDSGNSDVGKTEGNEKGGGRDGGGGRGNSDGGSGKGGGGGSGGGGGRR